MNTITVDEKFVTFIKTLNVQSKLERKQTYGEYFDSVVPDPVKEINKEMTDAGFEIYVVGGAIRNTMINYDHQNKKLDEMIAWMDKFEKSFADGTVKLGDKIRS